MNKLLSLTTVIAGMAVASIASAMVIQVDFAAADTDSPGNWNNLTNTGGTNLTDFNSGLATTIDLSLTGLSNSTSTGQWGSRTQSPAWATADALSDRLFMGEGNTGSMVISGLTPFQRYDIEIASSYGGAGTSGNDFGEYELTDANGLVEGFNASTSSSLGTTVSWQPRLQADSGTPDGVEGWLGWYDAEANASGELSFALATPTGANPRIALNAMQISAVPEPSAYALIVGMIAVGGALMRRRMRD
jgi:hypothetical protein